MRSWGPMTIEARPAAVGRKPKATLLEPDGMVSEAHWARCAGARVARGRCERCRTRLVRIDRPLGSLHLDGEIARRSKRAAVHSVVEHVVELKRRADAVREGRQGIGREGDVIKRAIPSGADVRPGPHAGQLGDLAPLRREGRAKTIRRTLNRACSGLADQDSARGHARVRDAENAVTVFAACEVLLADRFELGQGNAGEVVACRVAARVQFRLRRAGARVVPRVARAPARPVGGSTRIQLRLRRAGAPRRPRPRACRIAPPPQPQRPTQRELRRR